MSQTKQSPHILRRVGAVLAGLIFVIVITTVTNRCTHSFWSSYDYVRAESLRPSS